MTIEQNLWHITPEGEAVILYTLRNALGSEVRLSNAGASVVSVRFADRSGRIGDAVLGYGSAAPYLGGDISACGKTLGPLANCAAGRRVEAGGKTFTPSPDCGPYWRGAGKSFADRIWEARVETNRVVFSTCSEAGQQGLPHNVSVETVFDFDDDNVLEITHYAQSDGAVPVDISNRIYWNLSAGTAPTISDHLLRMNSSHRAATDVRGIASGPLVPTAGTVCDFSQWRRLGDTTDIQAFASGAGGETPALAIDGWRRNILGEAAELRDPASGRCVRISSSQPFCMLRCGEHLSVETPVTDDTAGSTPLPISDFGGVSFEFTAHPSLAGTDEYPSALLLPGQTYCQKTVFRLGVF